jgi:hypothetical protein
MTNFIIEKGIPLIETRNRIGKYPFPNMKVGDSFIFSEIYSLKLLQHISAAARAWAKSSRNNGWKFSARKTDNNKIRIWRIK